MVLHLKQLGFKGFIDLGKFLNGFLLFLDLLKKWLFFEL